LPRSRRIVSELPPGEFARTEVQAEGDQAEPGSEFDREQTGCRSKTYGRNRARRETGCRQILRSMVVVEESAPHSHVMASSAILSENSLFHVRFASLTSPLSDRRRS
jgi:hypothetical protein